MSRRRSREQRSRRAAQREQRRRESRLYNLGAVDVHATHLAVAGGNEDTSDHLFDLSRAEFHGTAFPLTTDLFISAWHVFDAAAKSGKRVAVGRVMTSPAQVQVVKDADLFPDIDLAILLCPGLTVGKLEFEFRTLPYLATVASLGFPFGLTLNRVPPHTYILRGFKGNIVTRRGLTELPAVPPGYETSFVAPPGLSGAPLLSMDRREPAVVGMMLREDTLQIGQGDAARSMKIGIALDIQELLTLDCKFVGGSIAERVFHTDRIPKRDGRP
jgi:hypothetical protein